MRLYPFESVALFDVRARTSVMRAEEAINFTADILVEMDSSVYPNTKSMRKIMSAFKRAFKIMRTRYLMIVHSLYSM